MANSEPHTHEVEMKQRYAIINRGPWEITYGDTTRVIRPWWCIEALCTGEHKPTEKRVQKAINRAIKEHDEGSKYNDMSRARQIVAEANNKLRPDQWASST